MTAEASKALDTADRLLRTVAAHQYDDLTSDRVWKTLTEDIPRLRTHLADVMLPGLRALAEGDPE